MIGVESNYGNDATAVQMFLTDSPTVSSLVLFLEEGKVIDGASGKRAPGIWMTNALKRTMAQATGYMVRKKRVKFSNRMVVTGDEYTGSAMREMIIEQLQNYKRIIRPTRNVYETAKEIFSGKDAGYDDLSIAFQLCKHTRDVFSGAEGKLKYKAFQ